MFSNNVLETFLPGLLEGVILALRQKLRVHGEGAID
jgi:hypothetical protein